MERDKFKKGIEEIKNIKLTFNQKQDILARLNEYTKSNPVLISNQPLKSPWYYSFKLSYVSYAFAFILVIGLGGFGAINNAQNSLPGDSLYPLKVDIIEPLQYSMAVGPVAKANVQSENLTQRLIEAEVLASQGRLSDSSGIEIENRLKKHVDSFNTLISESGSDTTLNKDTLDETKIDFEAAVSAHTKILEKIEERSINKSKNISKIRDAIQVEAQKVINTNDGNNERAVPMLMMVSSVSPVGTTTVDKTVFEQKKKEVEDIIKNTKKSIEKNKNKKVNKQILEESNKSILDAESALIRADESENSGNREKAMSDLIKSKKSVKEADASLRASSYIKDDDN